MSLMLALSLVEMTRIYVILKSPINLEKYSMHVNHNVTKSE